MMAVANESQAIGEFLEWANTELGAQLAYVPSYYEDTMVPLGLNTDDLLARFFNIDQIKVEKERRALLETLRNH